MIVHWSICSFLFLFDSYLYISNKWVQYKLNNTLFPVNLIDVVNQVLFNQIFVTFPIIYLFINLFPEGSLFELSNIYKIPITLLSIEFLFYYSHVILHFYFPKYHSIHHEWTQPCVISTLYCHPIEQVISNILPLILSGLISGLNINTMRAWHVLALSNTLISAHGGYKFFGNFHDLHHKYKNCNYGIFGMLDKFHKTYLVE
jgi:methylsterol monooxygenase